MQLDETAIKHKLVIGGLKNRIYLMPNFPMACNGSSMKFIRAVLGRGYEFAPFFTNAKAHFLQPS